MKKQRVDNQALPESEKEFEVGNNKKYKVQAIINSTIYDHKVENYLPDLYYLVL